MIRRVLMSAAIIIASARADAQAFFGGGAIAFDPEISVLNSGALLDVQPAVSNDLKYVTIGARPAVSHVIALQRFPVNAIVNQGFVGGVSLPSGRGVNLIAQPADPKSRGRDGRRGGDEDKTIATPTPDMQARSAKSWVFTRQGMYLIAPLP